MLRHLAFLTVGALAVSASLVGMLSALVVTVAALLRWLVPEFFDGALQVFRELPGARAVTVAGAACLFASLTWLFWSTGRDLWAPRSVGPLDRRPPAFAQAIAQGLARELGRLIFGAASVAVTSVGIVSGLALAIVISAWTLAPAQFAAVLEMTLAGRAIAPLFMFGGGCMVISLAWLFWSVGYDLERGI